MQDTKLSPELQNATAVNLFTPLTLKSITFRNRIGVSPMCQYISVDGFANEWHMVHLGSRAIGGAGLVIIEASGVEARGRITPDDMGIYKDEHVPKLKEIVEFLERFGAVAGIQIAHAGRKASTKNPWKIGDRHKKHDIPDSEGGWEIVAPSAIPFSPSSRVPHELTISEIKEIQEAFVAAANALLKRDSNFSKFIPRMDICCTASTRHCPTNAKTNMAARSKTASECCWKQSAKYARFGRNTCHSLFAYQQPIGSKAAGPSRTRSL